MQKLVCALSITGFAWLSVASLSYVHEKERQEAQAQAFISAQIDEANTRHAEVKLTHEQCLQILSLYEPDYQPLPKQHKERIHRHDKQQNTVER